MQKIIFTLAQAGLLFALALCCLPAQATDYYFHPLKGNDAFAGTSARQPFRTLAKIATLSLQPGDRLLLASGQIFAESLIISGVAGTPSAPIVAEPYTEEAGGPLSAIDAKGFDNGVLLENVSYVTVRNLRITAEGTDGKTTEAPMRVGAMVRVTGAYHSKGVTLENLVVSQVYFEDKGFVRSADEVKTENGTQRYGWGIRVMNLSPAGLIEEVKITGCSVADVSHTGIKLTGTATHNIRHVLISSNRVNKTGGPGIQMSGVKYVHVTGNEVTYSGSPDDSRKWGRGSGLWTWGASTILIEHNKFM